MSLHVVALLKSWSNAIFKYRTNSAMQNVPTSAMLTSLWWGSQILSILIWGMFHLKILSSTVKLMAGEVIGGPMGQATTSLSCNWTFLYLFKCLPNIYICAYRLVSGAGAFVRDAFLFVFKNRVSLRRTGCPDLRLADICLLNPGFKGVSH